MLIKMKACCNN